MKQVFGEVTANIALSPGTHILRVHAPQIALHAAPGQFVHVRCATGADPLLRRPLSIMRIPEPLPVTAELRRADPSAHPGGSPLPGWADGSANTGRGEPVARPPASPFPMRRSPRRGEGGEGVRSERFALLVEVVGRGSALLAASRVGDRLDLLGPLGRGFALHPKARQILLVAGGVGIAPLLALAGQALAGDVAVTLLFGARTAAKVFPAALVPPEVEYVVLTDDGSLGRQGLVTAALPDFLGWADQIFACGPSPMLRALALTLQQRPFGVPASSPPFVQVSLEQRMGCAMGACYGCVVDTVSGRQRVCRDGPVFDLFRIKWW